MRRPTWLLFVLVSLAAAAAARGPDGDEMERNRRLLEKWKADPAHYDRLKRDLAAFQALPTERQEQIRLLDRQLHECDPDTQAQLWSVLERYTQWLDRLPEAERRLVLDAPRSDSRLSVIHGLKRQQWFDQLPRGVRQSLEKMPPDQRTRRMAELRMQEGPQRDFWQRALQGKPDPMLRPERMADFPENVRLFIQQNLLPRMTQAEKKELQDAEGHFPALPQLIVRLADKYPVLPPSPKGAVKHFHELPKVIRNIPLLERERLKGPQSKIMPWHLQGRWPDFALAIVNLVKPRQGRVKPALGASRPTEFPPEIRAFLNEKLFPALSGEEKENLRRLEGAWPEYPLRLLRLARAKHLAIPGMSLPEPDLWMGASLAKTEVPDDFREGWDRIITDPKQRNNLDEFRKMWEYKPKMGPRHGRGGMKRWK
jgi:hypothetical protein